MNNLLLAVSVLAPAFLGQSQSGSILEEIAAQILGERFGLDTVDIFRVQEQTDEEIWDLGPTLTMSRYGNSTAYEVDRMRDSGLGWGEIAKRIGMHPGTFNKLRNQGYFDRDEFWDDVIHRRYDVDESELDWVRRNGGDQDDVLCSAIIAHSSRKRPTDVYRRYRSTKSWDETAKVYNVTQSQWRNAGTKVRWEGISTSPKSVKSKGQAASGKARVKTKGNSGGLKSKQSKHATKPGKALDKKMNRGNQKSSKATSKGLGKSKPTKAGGQGKGRGGGKPG